jgi:hypothetical protein
MCVTIPHITNPTLSKTRLRGLEEFLTGDNRTLLVVGYSARDKDISDMIGSKPSRFKAEVIEVGREGPGWTFSGLEGSFHGFRGVRFCVADHREFLKRLWMKSKQGPWIRGAKCSLMHRDNRWRTSVQSWADGLRRDSVSLIAERICSPTSFEGIESNPRIIIHLNDQKVEIVGDIIAINIRHSKNNRYHLMKYTPNSGIFLWAEFNRRMRSLGYLEKSRTIVVKAGQGDTTCLCNFKEREISFYMRRLLEGERSSLLFRSDERFREFMPRAEALLNSHSVLHALVQES